MSLGCRQEDHTLSITIEVLYKPICPSSGFVTHPLCVCMYVREPNSNCLYKWIVQWNLTWSVFLALMQGFTPFVIPLHSFVSIHGVSACVRELNSNCLYKWIMQFNLTWSVFLALHNARLYPICHSSGFVSIIIIIHGVSACVTELNSNCLYIQVDHTLESHLIANSLLWCKALPHLSFLWLCEYSNMVCLHV